MKYLYLSLATVTLLSSGSIFAQGYEHSLPLQIENKEQLYYSSESGSGKVSVKSLNNLVFNKPAVSTSSGSSEAIIKFNDIPGYLSLVLNNKKENAHVSGTNKLKISESEDGITYSNEKSYSANSFHNVTLPLDKKTRYIKFYYTCGGWSGWGFDPAQIALPKSIDIIDGNRSVIGKEGEVLKDTISVEYSNPLGNLVLETSNPSFTFKKITTENEANLAGTAQFEISYAATTAGENTANIKVYDGGYPTAFEEVNLTATVLAEAAPEAPKKITTSALSYTSFDLSWTNVENIVSYIVLLYNNELELIEEYPVAENTFSLSKLNPGTTYQFGVKSVNEAGKVSAISELTTITTKQIERPGNITVSSTKSAITVNWETIVDAHKYFALLANKSNQILEEVEIPTTQSSYTFSNLDRGTDYTVSVHTVIETFKSEAITKTATTTLDFGTQLQNNGFEKWEAVDKGSEPLNWNSFGTVGGGMAGFAKSEQVAASKNTRPGSNGNLSAVIYSKMIGSIAANGNMTTGRIYANSWTAADLSNYNAVVPSDPAFHQVVEEHPDSVSIWVKYTPKDATSNIAEARLSFILHGDGIVNDPSAAVSELVAAKAELNYTPCEWKRVTLPFNKINDVQPKFMLASLTTNKTPGVGTGGIDSVYVDDLVLIYKPTLTVEPLATTSFAEGDEFALPYTLTGSMSVSNIDAPANTVYAELSDNTGSFDNATIVSEAITTDESGVLQIKLPNKMISGSNYRIRVVTTNYPMSSEADQNLAIEGSDVPNSLEQVAKINCKIYPNPAKDRFFLSNAEGAIYQIRNIANQTVMTATYTSAGVDVADLNTGIYFIDIRMGSDVQQLKFIKE